MSDYYIQVAIPVPMRQLFTYLVPEGLNVPTIQLGERVVVSFGPREVIGVVMGVEQKCDIAPKKLKAIKTRVTDNFIFSDALINFLQRCANYYHHPIGDVLQQALPVLLRQIKQADIAPSTVWSINKSIADKSAIEKQLSKAPKQLELYQLINNHQNISWPELRTLGFTKSQLNALSNKSYISEDERSVNSFDWQESMLNNDDKHQLSVEQAIIVSAIKQTNNTFIIHPLYIATFSANICHLTSKTHLKTRKY